MIGKKILTIFGICLADPSSFWWPKNPCIPSPIYSWMDGLQDLPDEVRQYILYLEKKIQELEQRLKLYENPHTPSSQQRFKPNSNNNNPPGRRGAPPEHDGATRPTPTPDKIIPITMHECPRCGCSWGTSMDESQYGFLELEEASSFLEKHRRDVVENYLEYHLVMLQRLREQGKTLDDVIEQMKLILWCMKNERMHKISEEIGLWGEVLILLFLGYFIYQFVFNESFAKDDLAVIEAEENFVVWLQFENFHDFRSNCDPVSAVKGSWFAEEFGHSNLWKRIWMYKF